MSLTSLHTHMAGSEYHSNHEVQLVTRWVTNEWEYTDNIQIVYWSLLSCLTCLSIGEDAGIVATECIL